MTTIQNCHSPIRNKTQETYLARFVEQKMFIPPDMSLAQGPPVAKGITANAT